MNASCLGVPHGRSRFRSAVGGRRGQGKAIEQPYLHPSYPSADNFSLPGVPQTRGTRRLYISFTKLAFLGRKQRMCCVGSGHRCVCWLLGSVQHFSRTRCSSSTWAMSPRAKPEIASRLPQKFIFSVSGSLTSPLILSSSVTTLSSPFKDSTRPFISISAFGAALHTVNCTPHEKRDSFDWFRIYYPGCFAS